ncbi:MAG: shikimate dehydrogenase [Epsilonproteobacteria bacterium]|nr:shikimate dehydrogenase [Campylobacterota bacterium]NPA56615.1 shikimate dehydrogenase [Campylobacterota bacterium]
MRLYAIFGDPVDHSISPTLHNYTFGKLGFDGCYTKVHVREERGLRERFLDLRLQGINITIPHKEQAFLEADEVLGIARQIEAVNTWYLKDGKIFAYNTDAPGFYESVRHFLFKRPLIIGAGGTARAIALYLKEQGFNPVILNRSGSRLEFFKKKGIEAYTWEDFVINHYDLIINTTSAGLVDENLPAPKELLERLFEFADYAVDVIYNRFTPFLALAQKEGLQIKDGTDMLLYQGVLAFEIFTDFAYGRREIEGIMRESLKLATA